MERDDVFASIDDGHFFSILYVKSDGTVRWMNGRLGVRKHLKGGTRNVDDRIYNLFTFFDVKKQGYRSIHVENIVIMRAEGREVFRRPDAEARMKEAQNPDDRDQGRVAC